MIKVSCSTLSFDGFGDSDFVNTFQLAKRSGYKNIEFNMWHPSNLTASKIGNIKKRCSDKGLKAVALHVSSIGGYDYHQRSKDVCHKLRAIDSACELCVKRVVFSGSHPRGENGGMDAVLTVLEHIIPYAEEKDVMICLENHESNTIENMADYELILNEIASENIGMCMDTGHFEAAGVVLDDVMDKFSDKINHIHLKENGKFGIKDFSYFGQGTTDNLHVVKKIIKLGYSGYLNIEVSPEICDNQFDINNVIAPLEMFKKFETQ
jgi:sugar phosphate isomerase/epimerase